MYSDFAGGVFVCVSYVSFALKGVEVRVGSCFVLMGLGYYRAGGQYHWVAGESFLIIHVELRC